MMAEVRDRISQESQEDALRWMDALVPLTQELLEEIGALEGSLHPNARTVWPTTLPPEHWPWEGILEVVER